MAAGAESSEPSGWIKGTAWVLGIVAPLFVGGLGLYTNSLHDSTERELDSLKQQADRLESRLLTTGNTMERTSQQLRSHLETDAYWISRVGENAAHCADLEKELRSCTEAQRQIAGLERRLEKLEHHSSK
jgi:hypothetical protein